MSKTKAGALMDFFSSFGLDAYVETNVPVGATFPYLTYTNVSSAFGDGDVNITVNLWYYTDSEAIPNAKAEEISKAIGLGGRLIKCDDGLIWVKRGTPFIQSLNDDNLPLIKRRYINVSAEFLTL